MFKEKKLFSVCFSFTNLMMPFIFVEMVRKVYKLSLGQILAASSNVIDKNFLSDVNEVIAFGSMITTLYTLCC